MIRSWSVTTKKSGKTSRGDGPQTQVCATCDRLPWHRLQPVGRALSARVIAVVIALILARFYVGDPGRIVAIPVDGRAQTVFKPGLRFPAGLVHDFFAR